MQELAGVRRLSSHVAGLKPSGIRKFFDIAATMKDVISFGIGEPDFTTPEAHPRGGHGIRCRRGRRTIRPIMASWSCVGRSSTTLSDCMASSYDPVDEAIITVGVSEALYLTMTAILDPGDEVIIPTPCFVSYQPEVIMAGGVPVEIPTRMQDNFEVDPDRIRKAITPHTKVIFVGYPSNPTGAVASPEVLLKIATHRGRA